MAQSDNSDPKIYKNEEEMWGYIGFLLNKLDFPAPKKSIEKIIPNENFKIVK